MLPFLGTQLFNRVPQIKTKVYVKPTNTGLLLHYHNHVDNSYKQSLLYKLCLIMRTVCPQYGFIFQRSVSAWSLCFHVWSTLSTLIINSTLNNFVSSRVADLQPSQASVEMTSCDMTRVVIPFEDQDLAKIVKPQFKDLSFKLHIPQIIQPIFVSKKIGQDLHSCETKP